MRDFRKALTMNVPGVVVPTAVDAGHVEARHMDTTGHKGDEAAKPLFRFVGGRFTLLLASIITALAVSPFLVGFVHLKLLMDVCLTAILVSAIQAVSDRMRTFVIAVLLAIPYLFLKWSGVFADAAEHLKLAELFAGIFLGYVLVLILRYISTRRQVDSDVIMAAVCGYLLLGFMWAYAFFFLEAAQPGSFQFAREGAPATHDFIYFSFVTMTTVGYGDCLPASNAGRSLAVLEAVMGQLYLAVTIARLVGMQASRPDE